MKNQNKIKISVIMPIYKVEKYLDRAIKSVLNQTLNDFELFLVDDGSPDNSGKICDKYKLLDNRVKVIHKKNEGAHIARNTCIPLAKGKYVCFFDGDDYIENNMLEDLYNLAEKSFATMVVSGFFIETYVGKNKYKIDKYEPVNKVYNQEYEFRKDAYKYFDKNMFYSPWNKIYNLEYIKKNNINFPITYRDDFPFVVSIIRNIKNITFTKKCYYHFERVRIDSETQKYVKNLYDKRIEEHIMICELYKYWNLYDDNNSIDMISRRFIDRVLECIVNLYNNKCDLSNIEKNIEIKKYINSEYFYESFLKAKPKSLHLKIIYIILKTKNIFIISLLAKIIHFVKTNFLNLFINLKTSR